MIGEADQALVTPSGEYIYFGGQGGPRRKSEKAAADITTSDEQFSDAGYVLMLP
jgi:hypothetical protein